MPSAQCKNRAPNRKPRTRRKRAQIAKPPAVDDQDRIKPRGHPPRRRPDTIDAPTDLPAANLPRSTRNGALAGMIAAGVPRQQAMRAVGLSPASMTPAAVTRSIPDIRASLQADPDVGLVPTVRRIHNIAGNRKAAPSDRIAADRLLCKVLGYEAPARMEIDQRSDLAGAVGLLAAVVAQTGMSPRDLQHVAQSSRSPLQSDATDAMVSQSDNG